MDSTIILAATAGAFLLAGFVKGVIGLGLPTVSIGLLGLLMSPAQAAAILVVPSLVTNIWQAVVGGGLLALARRLWPMLVGICAGTFVGAVLLPHDDTGRQRLAWRGPCAVCSTRACECAFQRAAACGNLARPRHGRWRPARSRWRPVSSSCRALRTSSPCSSNATSSCRRLVCRLPFRRSRSLWRSPTQDKYAASLAGPSLVALIAALAGMVLGQLVRGRVRAETFRVWFFVGLLLLGAHLALRGLLVMD